MRLRVGLVLVAGLAAAGCTPTTPNDGVGFGDYATYMRDREAALASGGTGGPTTMPLPEGGVGTTGFSADRAAAAITAAEGGVPMSATTNAPVFSDPNDPNRPRGNAPANIRTESGEVQQQPGGSATISDEQDFNAVSSRETIESDAERLARARSQYTVVQPTAVPNRPGGTGGASLVDYALSTTHAPGTPVYRRSGFRMNSNPMANCGRYASADLAQEDFLSSGGPDRDRRGLDPDGDGFVCGWDPRPFRAARQ